MSQFHIIMLTILLLLLILLAAFFSFAETSLMVVNRYRLRYQARMKKRYALTLVHLLKRPDRVLGTILIGSTFTNILASFLATLLALHFWGDKAAFFVAVLLTLVILIFAEIAPKTLAAIYPDHVARLVVYPIHFLLKVFYPVVWLANAITNSLLRLLQIKVTNYSVEPLSREELRSVVFDTKGKISRQYQNMLLGILDLNSLVVDDVMVPRPDMAGVDIDLPITDILDHLVLTPHEWLPVYHEEIDQIIGVLSLRELLRLTLKETPITKNAILRSLNEPYFVPQGTSLNVQLAYFQGTQQKIAFVVDEYGEIQGSLTLNDILEEIVGDFTTSTSPLKKPTEKQRDGSFLVDGAVTIREFNRISQWELPQRGPRTVNGLIIEYLQALPRAGVTVLIAGYPIEIIKVKKNRVKLARIFPLIHKGKVEPGL